MNFKNLYLLRPFLQKLLQGISFGLGLLLIIGGVAYAAVGSQMVKTAGIDFIEYFNSEGGKAGMQAEAIHSTRLGTWFPYPENNINYLRGDTVFNGKLVDENNGAYSIDPYGESNLNRLCLNYDCRSSWDDSKKTYEYFYYINALFPKNQEFEDISLTRPIRKKCYGALAFTVTWRSHGDWPIEGTTYYFYPWEINEQKQVYSEYGNTIILSVGGFSDGGYQYIDTLNLVGLDYSGGYGGVNFSVSCI